MPERNFDVVVLGLGGMGSAALCELARRGLRVLGLEQYSLGHELGSSHGQTRIIRQAYYEHPDYVPLAQRAYDRWRLLEEEQGVRLLTICPCLSIGWQDSELIQGVQSSAGRHQLPIECLELATLRKRYPDFRFDDEYVGIVESTAGYLLVDVCVTAQVAEARRRGAVIQDQEAVESWQAEAGGVRVKTARGEYQAKKLIISAGPWAAGLLRDAGIPLTVMRQVPLWFEPDAPARFRPPHFPIFIADTPKGYFYGLPMIDDYGVKLAQHYGAPELSSPAEVQREVTVADEQPVRQFLQTHVPAANGPRRRASVCIYTLTPDRHFVVDLHPHHDNVVLAAGFSGHGFKFAPVIGEIVADLAEKGRTALPIGRFTIRRFAGKTDHRS